MIGPGVSGECIEERNGSHINEDHFLPEVVDPESGEQLPEGELGVLVLHDADEAGAAARSATGRATSRASSRSRAAAVVRLSA